MKRNFAIKVYAALLFFMVAICIALPVANMPLTIVGLLAIAAYFAHLTATPDATGGGGDQYHALAHEEAAVNAATVNAGAGADAGGAVAAPLRAKAPRLYYLDNVKSILTLIVVLHHTTADRMGTGGFYMVGLYHNPFQLFGATFCALNQSCAFASRVDTPAQTCGNDGRRS